MRTREDSSAHQPSGNLRTPHRRRRSRRCHCRRPRASSRPRRRPQHPWCRRRRWRGGGGSGGGGAGAPQRRRAGGASEIARPAAAAGVVTPPPPARPPTPTLLRWSCRRRSGGGGSKAGATRGAAGSSAAPRHSPPLPSTAPPRPHGRSAFAAAPPHPGADHTVVSTAADGAPRHGLAAAQSSLGVAVGGGAAAAAAVAAVRARHSDGARVDWRRSRGLPPPRGSSHPHGQRGRRSRCCGGRCGGETAAAAAPKQGPPAAPSAESPRRAAHDPNRKHYPFPHQHAALDAASPHPAADDAVVDTAAVPRRPRKRPWCRRRRRPRRGGCGGSGADAPECRRGDGTAAITWPAAAARQGSPSPRGRHSPRPGRTGWFVS